MAPSNEFGWMVLTTGTRAAAVGYFTIYGDSVGGYAVIKDLLKLKVYDLADSSMSVPMTKSSLTTSS